jgi:tetrapyrrole methylase family protein / MazG family protein
MAITIVGLGPGPSALMTLEAWEILTHASEAYLRTIHHPAVGDLPAGLTVHSFDALYEQAEDFADVYRAVTERILELGRRPEGVIYCVPGHPLVGESTITDLLERAEVEGLPVRIVAGVSFIEPTLTAIRVDPISGLQLVDAIDVALRLHPPLNPDVPALLAQLYDRDLASDVKLTLMNQYPDEHQVTLLHGAGTEEEWIETAPLHALDHSRRIGHLTSVYVPALPRTSGLESFQETIARLRAPDGCPWDREQTHQSLRSGLLEETAEVLDALDADDMDALCEELGDLLLHVVMQGQIATEEGDFTTADVIAGIEAKIRRRHPHVFGDVHVSSTDDVLVNWDQIKQAEQGRGKATSALDKVPAALPALARAWALTEKADQMGADQPGLEHLVAQVRLEMEGLLEAPEPDVKAVRVGDLLLAVVRWARWLDVDPEIALRNACQRFSDRFRTLEEIAAEKGCPVGALSSLQRGTLWQSSRSEPG